MVAAQLQTRCTRQAGCGARLGVGGGSHTRAERLTDLGASTTEPRDSNVSDEDLLTLNPGCVVWRGDDVVLKLSSSLGPLSRRPGQVVSLSRARDIPRS